MIFCFSLLKYTYYCNYRSHISLQVAKLMKSAGVQILIFPTVYMCFYSSANRERVEQRRTGGWPPPPAFTTADELALDHNRGRPIMDGIAGGSSSEPSAPHDTSAYVKGKLITFIRNCSSSSSYSSSSSCSDWQHH